MTMKSSSNHSTSSSTSTTSSTAGTSTVASPNNNKKTTTPPPIQWLKTKGVDRAAASGKYANPEDTISFTMITTTTTTTTTMKRFFTKKVAVVSLVLLVALCLYCQPRPAQLRTAQGHGGSSLMGGHAEYKYAANSDLHGGGAGASRSHDRYATPHDVTSWYNASKPSFILHVGPSKTATTTMQDDLAELDVKGYLNQDNYVYLGRGRIRFPRFVMQERLMDRKCLRELKDALSLYHKKPSQVPCWNKVLQELQFMHKKGQSIILSSEYMSNDESIAFRPGLFHTMTTQLVAALKEIGYNPPVVVVGFRRYTEWSLSALKQHNRLGCATRWKYDMWDIGPCPSAQDKVLDEWAHRDPPSANHYHYSHAVIDTWTNSSNNLPEFPIALLNFHEPGHITTKFVCGVIPDMPHTCQHTLTRPEPEKQNVADAITGALSTIAYEGYTRGFINGKKNQRKNVQLAMDAYMEEHFPGKEADKSDQPLSYADFPLTNCATDAEMEQLLNLSLTLERDIVPNFYQSDQGESVHKAGFWKDHHKKRLFCELDLDIIFSQDKKKWDDVLMGIVNFVRGKRAAAAEMARQKALEEEQQREQEQTEHHQEAATR